MLTGVKVTVYTVEKEGSLEMDLNPDDDVLTVECPFQKFSINIEDLKLALRRLEVE